MATKTPKVQSSAAPSAEQTGTMEVGQPAPAQLSVSQAMGDLVKLSLEGVSIVRQGDLITRTDGTTAIANATIVSIAKNAKLKELNPKLNSDGIATKRESIGAEIKKLDASLSGAQAADVATITRSIRVHENTNAKSKANGLKTTHIIRQEIRIRDEAEAMVAAHGKTAEFWRKVIALNTASDTPQTA